MSMHKYKKRAYFYIYDNAGVIDDCEKSRQFPVSTLLINKTRYAL